MKAKIGSPLYILRHECQKDLLSVIEKLAEMGFDGIEFAGLFGQTPVEIKRKLDSCEISAIGNHVPFNDFVTRIDKVIYEHKELGCKYITIGAPESGGFPGNSDYNKTLESLRLIGETMNKAELTLLYHNHAEEIKGVYNGKSLLENIMDDIEPALLSLEPDFGWMQIGGAEPLYYLNKYENRCPIVHFKDFIPASETEYGFVFRPIGYGIVDNALIYERTQYFSRPPEWCVLDHDCSYEREPFFDLGVSLNYFKNLMLF